ncbi:MAG: hypothetical protein EP309_02070 [Gammaproteobacteria bacterium]|nr:MAG: hypothetical protein EP309_02070 [Gammaproteobacteria bacterium]
MSMAVGWTSAGRSPAWPFAGVALAGLSPLSPTQSHSLRGILPASLAVLTAAIALQWGGEGSLAFLPDSGPPPYPSPWCA